MARTDVSGDMEEINDQVTSGIIRAVEGAIHRTKNRMNMKPVPWRTEECRQAVRNRNRAFKQLERTKNIQHLIQYKKAQAAVRRTVCQAKRASLRKFYDKIGRTTPVEEVWGMIKKMGVTEGYGITQS